MSDQQPSVAPHHPYTIISQAHGEELDASGRFIPTWTVMFSGPNGTTASVKIPDAQYTAAHVDREIQGVLDRVMGVHDLGPAPHPENHA